MFILKPLLRTLILPPAGPLLLAFVGLLLLRYRPRLGKVLIASGVALLWILATPVVADGLLRLAERSPTFKISNRTDAQAVVILGSGGHQPYTPEYDGPSVDGQLLERITYGAFVAKQTHLPILVSGTDQETQAMSTMLARNFAEPVRWIENRSRDTYENARFSVAILSHDGIRHVLLVTSSTHMFRAAQEFQTAGIVVTPAPVSVGRDVTPVLRWVPSTTGLARSHYAIYELIGEPVRQILAASQLRK